MKSVLLVAASIVSVGLLSPVTAVGQNAGAYYSATPATASAKASFVTRSIIWKCADGVCGASKGNARDAIVCELAAREVGALTAFRANGVDFDTDALTKCNAKAR